MNIKLIIILKSLCSSTAESTQCFADLASLAVNTRLDDKSLGMQCVVSFDNLSLQRNKIILLLRGAQVKLIACASVYFYQV